MKTDRRSYRMGARAEATRATHDRILDAARDHFMSRWYDEITMADLASAASVSAQTVVNHFGTKAGVLVALATERLEFDVETVRYRAAPGDVEHAIEVLVEDYEPLGDAVVRALALELRLPELTPALDRGRAGHRNWIAHVFGPLLRDLPEAAREHRLMLLATVTDVYVWHLLRRDRGLDQATTTTAMRELVEALLAAPDPDPKDTP